MNKRTHRILLVAIRSIYNRINRTFLSRQSLKWHLKQKSDFNLKCRIITWKLIPYHEIELYVSLMTLIGVVEKKSDGSYTINKYVNFNEIDDVRFVNRMMCSKTKIQDYRSMKIKKLIRKI